MQQPWSLLVSLDYDLCGTQFSTSCTYQSKQVGHERYKSCERTYISLFNVERRMERWVVFPIIVLLGSCVSNQVRVKWSCDNTIMTKSEAGVCARRFSNLWKFSSINWISEDLMCCDSAHCLNCLLVRLCQVRHFLRLMLVLLRVIFWDKYFHVTSRIMIVRWRAYISSCIWLPATHFFLVLAYFVPIFCGL